MALPSATGHRMVSSTTMPRIDYSIRIEHMLARSTLIASVAAVTALLAGCSDTSSLFGNSANNLTTASVAAPAVAAAKTDPACPGLASQMDALRKEGIADKVEKAAAKKYKMTVAELGKADQLNKLSVDFQGKCSSFKPVIAAAPAAVTPAAVASVAKAAPAAAKTAAAAAPAAAAAVQDAASAAVAAAKPQ
jgi:hypothetical protein